MCEWQSVLSALSWSINITSDDVFVAGYDGPWKPLRNFEAAVDEAAPHTAASGRLDMKEFIVSKGSRDSGSRLNVIAPV